MKKASSLFAALIGFSVAFLSHAQGNLVFNGGFDGNADGWTLENQALYLSGGSVRLGSLSPSPLTDPIASQTINSLTPSATYLVAGEYRFAKNQGGADPTNYSFGVAIGGNFLFKSVVPLPSGDWHSFDFFYSASSSSVVLSLSGEMNGTGISYFIDNISMHEVPEPSAFLLFLFGGSTVVWLRRKRAMTSK
jgi:hypothetical protein